MGLYSLVADLPVTVESYELEGLEQGVSSDFVRRTTVVHLRGAGEEGVGEDVIYDAEEQLRFQAAGPVLDLAGRAHARLALAALRGPARTTAAGGSRARRSTWRSGRPACRSTRCSGASRGR